MSSLVSLPQQIEVSRMLAGIVGRSVTATKAAPSNLQLKQPRIYGVYQDRITPDACMAVFDLPLSAYAGGAMLTFPACAIKDSLKSAHLEDGILDTLREIMNIFAQLFNAHGHQKFVQLYCSPEELTEAGRAVLENPTGRLDLNVSIDGYGSGQVTLMTGIYQVIESDTTLTSGEVR